MIYLDTSAVVKLVLPEAETPHLRAWLAEHEDTPRVASRLVRVELLRAVQRVEPGLFPRAYGVLTKIGTVSIDRVCTAAETTGSATLRSLDAIHLATARHLYPALTAFVAYDKRLIDAAIAESLPVVTPA